jgi:hypothetical protein
MIRLPFRAVGIIALAVIASGGARAETVRMRDLKEGAEAVYSADWNDGQLEGWEPGSAVSSVSAMGVGGQPLGYLLVKRQSGTPLDAGAMTTLPAATGDYAGRGVRRIQFDLLCPFAMPFLRLQPIDGSTPGWRYRVPVSTPNQWHSWVVPVDPSWSNFEAGVAGWSRESGAPDFSQVMASVHSVGFVFGSSPAILLQASIDNFALMPGPTCYRDLPNPMLVFKGKSERLIDGVPYTYYDLDIPNANVYPAEYFTPAPQLPPCGLNPSASRAWVEIYQAGAGYLYGFCAQQSAGELRTIWFALPSATPPPDVYVDIWDRECDIRHRSNVVSTVTPNRGVPPVAEAGPDQVVECASSTTTAVRLDGTGSYDPDGASLTYEWSAPGVSFDDPTSPTPVGAFPGGETGVTLTVWDGAYEARDTMKIRVVDTTPPALQVEVSPAQLWPPNHQYVDVRATVRVEDACDPAPVATLSRITVIDSGGDTGGGPGGPDVAGAEYGTADLDFQLRAERSGSGEGRRYEIVYSASDQAGNTVLDTAYVAVAHDQRGQQVALGERSNDIPGGPEFALAGPRPSPGARILTVAFSLPSSSPARLELLDLAGRKIIARDVGALGPGSHVVNLAEGRALPAGVYLIRLTQGSRSAMSRAVVLR